MRLLFPDFVCIGAQKAGTTWLFNQLIECPEVCIPKKECNYLSLTTKSIKKYTEMYKHCAKNSLLGDISPYYATQNFIANYLYSVNPNTRIIFLIREPVSRAFSQYRMAQTAGRIPKNVSFLGAFRRNLQFMKRRGCYLEVLREYEKAGFTAENMLLLPFEWISQTPDVLLDHVDKFLGIEVPKNKSIMVKSFASATHGAKPPESEAARIKKWYIKQNKGLEEYLWWSPEWLA